MARSAVHRINPRVTLVALVAAMAFFSFTPATMLSWTRWFNTPVELALGPVQAPVRKLTVWMLGDNSPGDRDVTLDQAVRERDEWHARFLQLREQMDAAERRIEQLQRGASIDLGLDLRQLAAPVIGTGSDLRTGLLKVRAGSMDEVVPNSTVAVVEGIHLVGRVVDVRSRFCSVLPITAPDAPIIEGVVMLDDSTRGPICLLEPNGTGGLAGRVGETSGDSRGTSPAPIEPGMIVRLSDRTWPLNARMLVLGRITRVSPSPDHPLHKTVTIEPEFSIERVSEVVLRITKADTIDPDETP